MEFSKEKMNKPMALLFVIFILVFLGCIGEAAAEERQPSLFAAATGSPQGSDPAGDGKDLVYHTPLAGEAYHMIFMGEPVDVPAEDRGHVTALTIGGTFYTPKQGSTAFQPIGSLYVKRVWEESRTRNSISIFVNSLEYDRNLDHIDNLELVGLFDNYTIPVAQK